MKTIPLTQDKVAIVDDSDFEWLNQWKWHCLKDHRTFYAVRSGRSGKKRILILMHRLILNPPVGFEADHKNRNGLDNRRENLRSCTSTENRRNSDKQRNNTSGIIGVIWHKRDKKWETRIGFNNQRIHLGCFDNKTKAAEAYDCKAKELFGEFACLNSNGGTGTTTNPSV